jgi:Holliday junction resolvase
MHEQELQVPDILCVASIEGKPLPILIEVKKSTRTSIVWSQKYIGGLRAYADALGLPLLLAWKHHHLWALIDIRHFEKKVDAYHLTLEKALRENLMSQMFGDLLIVLTQRVALFIDAEVTGDAPLPPLPALLPEGTHNFKITGAGFLVDGKRIDLSSELSGLFFRAPSRSQVERTSEKTVRILYSPEPETMFSLMDFALMLMLGSQDENPDWEKVARDEISTAAEDVRRQLRAGIKTGVVQYVIEQKPNTKPDFIMK